MGFSSKICWSIESVRRHEKKTPGKLAYRGVFFDMVTYGESRT